jgi:hypothetical protein
MAWEPGVSWVSFLSVLASRWNGEQKDYPQDDESAKFD